MAGQGNGVAVLAGNSRVQLREDGSIQVEAQLLAFEAALRFDKGMQGASGELPRISVAFDHHGVFRLQFLRDGLTNSQKRNPRLNHVKPEIANAFTNAATNHGIPLDAIWVIHEDSARQHAAHVLDNNYFSEAVRRRMVSRRASDAKPSAPGEPGESTEKLTCAVITKEYFEKASDRAAGACGILEVFFEDSAWSRDLAYVRGLQLSHLLGVETAIRLNLVDSDGGVNRGQLVSSKTG